MPGNPATGQPKEGMSPMNEDKYKDMPEGYVLHEDEATPTTCCGKCCQNPATRMRPASTAQLAIFPLTKRKACSVPPLMNPMDVHLPPEQLMDLGLTAELWSRYMRRLETDVQSKQHSDCKTSMCCILTCCVSICCFDIVSDSKSYHAALKAWQDDFNEDLAKVNMFCKTQCHVHGWMQYVSNGSGGGSVQRFEAESPWLAIAVGDEAIATLKAAPHITQSGVHRYPNQGKGCCTSCCKEVSSADDWVI